MLAIVHLKKKITLGFRDPIGSDEMHRYRTGKDLSVNSGPLDPPARSIGTTIRLPAESAMTSSGSPMTAAHAHKNSRLGGVYRFASF